MKRAALECACVSVAVLLAGSAAAAKDQCPKNGCPAKVAQPRVAPPPRQAQPAIIGRPAVIGAVPGSVPPQSPFSQGQRLQPTRPPFSGRPEQPGFKAAPEASPYSPHEPREPGRPGVGDPGSGAVGAAAPEHRFKPKPDAGAHADTLVSDRDHPKRFKPSTPEAGRPKLERVDHGKPYKVGRHTYKPVRAARFAWPPGFSYQHYGIGYRVPPAFWLPNYYIDNYLDYGVEPPPGGFQWIRYGPDLLLINLGSGEVANAVPGVFVESDDFQAQEQPQ